MEGGLGLKALLFLPWNGRAEQCYSFCKAGELYEKVGKNDKAMESYRKGNAYRRGESNNFVPCLFNKITCML